MNTAGMNTAGRDAVGGNLARWPVQGPAVFVGRASFHMTAGDLAAVSGEIDVAVPEGAPETLDQRWFERSEPVVLLPPDGVAQTRKGFDGVARQRRTPPWRAIAAVLVVGASAAWGAQSLIRRSTRVVVAPINQIAPVTRAVAVAAPVAAPTVVPSTIVAPPVIAEEDEDPNVEDPSLSPGAVAGGLRPERVVRRTPPNAARERSAGPKAVTRVLTNGSSTWVDPFAGETLPTLTRSKPSTSGRSTPIAASRTKKTIAAVWVDPFAN